MTSARPFPLPSDVESTRRHPRDYLYRAAACYVRAHLKDDKPERIAKEMFGNDVVTELVVRAASAQATIGSPSWAGALAQQVVDDSIMAIASLSAAAGLIQRGMKIDFGRRASIRVPGRVLDASDAGQWVGEGRPVVMRTQRMTAGPTLTPHKLCVLTSYSREMTEQSAIVDVSRALITEATALSLDKALFGTQADDGVTPGGILNGVTPLTPTTGGGAQALAADIKQLVGALVAAFGGRDPVLVMNPSQATSLKILASPKFDTPVLQSTSVPVGTIIAVEPSSFVSAFDPVPEFDTTTSAVFHYEDTAPTDITGGTPSPAVPVRSLFQTDSIALRMLLKIHFGMRAPHIAYIQGVTW
jgi:HK97 family phage major capsid protein